MTVTEYKNIGETLISARLSNGLEIRMIPKPGFSSFYALFGTSYGGAMRNFEIDGRRLETPAGVAHFLEHKMFDLPGGDNALSILSANGADPNAFTSSSATCYYFRCTESFEENLRVLLHFVSTPYFTKETVEKEQGIIGQEIQMVDDSPNSEIYYNLLSLLYDHHPIKDKVAGSIESIARITDETLYSCHRVFYAPSNMVLCLEGDIDPQKVIAIAEEELSEECAPVPRADYGEPEGPEPVGKISRLEMEVSAPQFLIGQKLEAGTSLKERLTADLSLKLICGSSSPLYSRLYSSGLITGDFDFELDYAAGTATLIGGGESSEPERVLAELEAEIERIRQEGIEPDYFRRCLNASLGARLRSLEDFEDVCTALAFGIFEGYNYMDCFALGSEISLEDCMSWIKEKLRPEHFALSIINPVTK